MLLHRVDVGRSQLAVEVRGSRRPAVVFVSGVTDDRRVWDAVVNLLPADTLTLTFDRPGLGDSSPLATDRQLAPEGTTGTVQDLHTATAMLHVPIPLVLVGHSLGALLAYAYAARHAKHCAGLILVDPSDPSLLPPLAGFHDTLADSDKGTTYSWHAISDDIANLPIPTAPAVVIASAAGRWLRVTDAERYSPLSMSKVDARWQRWQREIAQRLDARLVIATDAGHRVHSEAPDLVASVILAVVEAARSAQQPDISAGRPTDLPGNRTQQTGTT